MLSYLANKLVRTKTHVELTICLSGTFTHCQIKSWSVSDLRRYTALAQLRVAIELYPRLRTEALRVNYLIFTTGNVELTTTTSGTSFDDLCARVN